MVMLRIHKENGDRFLHGLTKVLTVSLALLTLVVIFVSYDNPSITGNTVFSNIYGGASSYVIVFVLFAVIYLYYRLAKA